MKRHLCVGEESTFGMSRRGVLNRFGMGLGGIALSEMISNGTSAVAGVDQKTHLPAKAKRVIYLFQSGGPSQMLSLIHI